MMKNDYRRALILLRSNKAGYSGHVRLERRTMMGSMYFLIRAPEDCPVLRAALVGRDKAGYYACALGEMQRDGRGQAVLGYSFDPRNICQRELEQYQLIVVSCAGSPNCEILLWGNVCGHADLNWERVRTALCGLYSDGIAREEDAPAAESPGQEAMPPEMPEAAQAAAEPEAPEPIARSELPRDIPEDIPEEPAEIIEDTVPEENLDHPQTAGELLGIDMDLPWPQSIEPVRALFRISVPMENPPDGEYVYIAAAMPPESGYACSAIGVRAQDGVPASVRYGLPAPWSDQPPAGLEDYTWVGSQNQGWWMLQIDFPRAD